MCNVAEMKFNTQSDVYISMSNSSFFQEGYKGATRDMRYWCKKLFDIFHLFCCYLFQWTMNFLSVPRGNLFFLFVCHSFSLYHPVEIFWCRHSYLPHFCSQSLTFLSAHGCSLADRSIVYNFVFLSQSQSFPKTIVGHHFHEMVWFLFPLKFWSYIVQNPGHIFHLFNFIFSSQRAKRLQYQTLSLNMFLNIFPRTLRSRWGTFKFITILIFQHYQALATEFQEITHRCSSFHMSISDTQ